MSRRNYGRNNKRSSSSKKSGWLSKAEYESQMLKLAENMGKIERGRLNKNSKVSEAYERGLKSPEKREKKSLF